MNDAAQPLPGWQPAPVDLSLTGHSVHVWLLVDDSVRAITHREVLAPDERERAARLDDRHARSFTATRSLLRILLSRYTGHAADHIAFGYGPLGKPLFEEGGIHFSVSHAGDRALLAFSRSCAVGVDLERVKGNRRFDALSARFFSDANARTVALASRSALPTIFTQAWAQREAYVKAVGGGLYATPDALPFSPGRSGPQVLQVEGATWTVAAVDAGTEFEARLVANGVIDELAFFRA